MYNALAANLLRGNVLDVALLIEGEEEMLVCDWGVWSGLTQAPLGH